MSGPDYSCRCGCGRKDFIPPYLFLGPERATDPGGLGPYTADVFAFRGYQLSKRNLWSRTREEWHSRDTSINARGLVGGPWLARVAGVEADGATMLEALEEAWAGAEFEDQLRCLLPPKQNHALEAGK